MNHKETRSGSPSAKTLQYPEGPQVQWLKRLIYFSTALPMTAGATVVAIWVEFVMAPTPSFINSINGRFSVAFANVSFVGNDAQL